MEHGENSEPQSEPCRNERFRMDGYRAAVQTHDLAGQAETNACTGRLCGKKRNENIVQYMRLDTRPIVAYLNNGTTDIAKIGLEFDLWSLCFFYRFDCVLDQVDQDLLDHGPICCQLQTLGVDI